MKAMIIGVQYYKMDYDLEESMRELENLCVACDIEVHLKMVQSLDHIQAATFIGSGKINEIKPLLSEVDLVVFNEELTPMQITNLNDLLEIEVIDRTDLILRIFESRAKTIEAKLQVKIAKLKYMLPRLSGMNEAMSHQMGGSNFRGSGEKQIELDRRHIANSLHQAKMELASLVKQRQTQRKKRAKNVEKVVALVGYTNSGKSSMMNYYVEKGNVKQKTVLQKDMLFATLETSTRMIHLKNKRPFLLSDTVGFIHQLPISLVQAFRSTLEEVKEADLIVIVVDSSSPYYEEHIETTKSVLEELEVDRPILYVYNKIDLNKYAFVKTCDPYVFVSVKEDKNMDTLTNKILSMLYADDKITELKIPYHRYDIVSKLLENTTIYEMEHLDDGVYMKIQCIKEWDELVEPFRLTN